MNNTSILVVDDDEEIIKFLRTSLEKEEWEIIQALDGEEAIQIVENKMPDLVILDIMMPKVDGIEVCRNLRSKYSVPIIMLSARGELSDKIRCLDMGADDYLTKPFDIEELIARIKAVLRRNKQIDITSSQQPFICENLKIDFNKRQVISYNRELRLTPTECTLLQELVHNAGKTLSYKYLLNKIWGPEYGTEREYLHVYIGHLRSKLELDTKHPEFIISVPGIGYFFHGNV